MSKSDVSQCAEANKTARTIVGSGSCRKLADPVITKGPALHGGHSSKFDAAAFAESKSPRLHPILWGRLGGSVKLPVSAKRRIADPEQSILQRMFKPEPMLRAQLSWAARSTVFERRRAISIVLPAAILIASLWENSTSRFAPAS